MTVKPEIVPGAVYEVAPYGSVEELLDHSTTQYALIRQDSTVIGDLTLAEANLFAGAPDLLAALDRLTYVQGQMPAGAPETIIALTDAYDAAIAAIAKAEGNES